MDPITVPALLSGAVTALSGTAVFLFLRLEKAKETYIADLKAEHAARLADKDKATAAILEQSNRAHDLVDRLTDVFETMSGRKIQP